MSKYILLDDLMFSIYSVEIGLSEEAGKRLFIRSLASKEYRDAMSAEIDKAFADKDFSWKGFFEESDIMDANDEESARAYAKTFILDPLLYVKQHQSNVG
ncbi:hypothetical protein PO883_34060 [Massilia sp. DJPM01]|uniref:hypothetical protein n=1 Tax=Massilia sp. DJPM01 TaxID=3024404 RepID=UPI00259DD108|nr:hypothetical protein [Massilia sp. DJPM01]MDM5182195.1 hypothetical protein [Massilia sp. DJPM01]